MDNRSLMLLEIDNFLNEISGLVRIRNYNGNYDINKTSENHAINLFNRIYGLNLKNANNIISDNFPAIDLIDDTNSVAIQVTSTSTKDKIIYTLKKFIEKDLHKSYNKLILYILTDKPKSYNAKTIKEIESIAKGFIKFNIKNDVIDNKDLSKEVHSFININKVKEIYEYLVEEFTNYKTKSDVVPKELNAFAKYPSENLLGRDSVIDDIYNKFLKNDVLILQGVGGIGKTAIAKSYLEAHKDNYEHLAYIDITDSLISTIFKKLNSIDSTFVYDHEESVTINLHNLINKLYAIKNTLLIIDNCNDESELRQFKNDLESIKWKILITSRAIPAAYNNQVININHLLPEICYNLFEKNYRLLNEEEKAIVNRILLKIKYHTKLTIILAKAAFNNPLLKLEELADQVYKEEYKDEKINVLVSLDTEEYPVYDFLLLLFKPESLNSDQQRYLKYFSILPNQEISVEHLVRIFERNENQGFFINVINKLTEKGWIEKYDTYYRIHPLIQLVTREKLYITLSNCGTLIDNLIYFLDQPTNYTDSASYLPYAESVANFFKDELDFKIGILNNHIAIIYKMLFEFNTALKYASRAVEASEFDKKLSNYYQKYLAQIYGNKADICGQLFQFEEAKNLFRLTLGAQEKMFHKDHIDLATTYQKFSLVFLVEARESNIYYNKKQLYNSGIDISKEAIRIFENEVRKFRRELDIKNLCISYGTLAVIYSSFYSVENDPVLLEQHLYYDEKALDICIKYLGDTDPVTADTYNNNGLNYLILDQLENAKEYIEKGLNIRKTIFPENHPTIGQSLLNMSRVYIKLKERRLALLNIKEAISVLQTTNLKVDLELALKIYNSIR